MLKHKIVDFILNDPAVRAMYTVGDSRNEGETYHDWRHAMDVFEIAMNLVNAINTRRPGTIDDLSIIVVAIAALLHDAGYALKPSNHATAGAQWSSIYLAQLGVDKQLKQEVARAIGLHQSQRTMAHRAFRPGVLDIPAAVLTIADKNSGGRSRVREHRRLKLEMARNVGTISLAEMRGWDIHDYVNFAILKSELIVAEKIRFHYEIDEVMVGIPELILEVFGTRYTASVKCASYLGFELVLQFNAVEYLRHGESWHPVSIGNTNSSGCERCASSG